MEHHEQVSLCIISASSTPHAEKPASPPNLLILNTISPKTHSDDNMTHTRDENHEEFNDSVVNGSIIKIQNHRYV